MAFIQRVVIDITTQHSQAGYDVEDHLVELKVPWRAGRPGRELDIPDAFDTLEVEIAQPAYPFR